LRQAALHDAVQYAASPACLVLEARETPPARIASGASRKNLLERSSRKNLSAAVYRFTAIGAQVRAPVATFLASAPTC
jgi:hypothetical protein